MKHWRIGLLGAIVSVAAIYFLFSQVNMAQLGEQMAQDQQRMEQKLQDAAEKMIRDRESGADECSDEERVTVKKHVRTSGGHFALAYGDSQPLHGRRRGSPEAQQKDTAKTYLQWSYNANVGL